MSNDVLLKIGKETDLVYLLLEGEIEGINIEDKKYIKLLPGDFFGAFIPFFKIRYEYKAL